MNITYSNVNHFYAVINGWKKIPCNGIESVKNATLIYGVLEDFKNDGTILIASIPSHKSVVLRKKRDR